MRSKPQSMSRGTAVRKAAKAPIATEHQEQKALFTWAEIAKAKHPELRLLFAVPNGARTSMSVARRLKAEGLKAGVPDVWLPVARGDNHGLVIEMKRTKGGTLSPEQKDWIERLRAENYFAVVCWGWQEAVENLEWYLKQGAQ